MPYNNQYYNKSVEGTPEFIQVNTFYKLFEQYEMMFSEGISQQHSYLMKSGYIALKDLVMPYIQQYIVSKEKYKSLLVADIEELSKQYRPGKSDFDTKENNKINTQLFELLLKKHSELHKYIAKANLLLRLEKKDNRPAALGTDDW